FGPNRQSAISIHNRQSENPQSPIRNPQSTEALVDLVPVDDVPPGSDVVGTTVLVLQVVGVLPHVEAENRLLPFHQRAVLVRGALDGELPADIEQPRPAA